MGSVVCQVPSLHNRIEAPAASSQKALGGPWINEHHEEEQEAGGCPKKNSQKAAWPNANQLSLNWHHASEAHHI